MTEKQLQHLNHHVSNFLSQNFTPWDLHEFSELHTKQLFTLLLNHYSESELLGLESELRSCFLDFFNKMGRINVKILGLEDITITTTMRESTQKAFTQLQHYQSNFEVKKDANLLIISEQITEKMFKHLNIDMVYFRDDIKATLPHVIDIGKNYAILFGKSRITVRTKLNEESNEKRFLGLPEKDLKELTASLFKDLDGDIAKLMKPYLEREFNFKIMSNDFFEAQHIKLLQEGLIKILQKRTQQDDQAIKGLANYILRLQFENLHLILAKQLLTRVLSHDHKAEQFLNYFTQDKISINSIKYKIPSLKDRKGNIWSFSNINNVALQYRNYMHTVEQKSAVIAEMSEVLAGLDKKISLAGELREKAESAEASNQKEMQENAKKIRGMRHIFQAEGHNLDKKRKEAMNREIKALTHLESDFMVQQRECERTVGITKKAHSDLLYKQNFAKERITTENSNLADIKKVYHDIQDKYDLTLSAITHALLGKKAQISG
jgi:hypothetical protein